MSNNTSWYSKNLKYLNGLIDRLEKYMLQGSFERELDLKEIINVIRSMGMEITSLQNKLLERDITIGQLKLDAQKLTNKKDRNINK